MPPTDSSGASGFRRRRVDRATARPDRSPGSGMNSSCRVGSGGTSSGFSGRTSRGVISTISSVRSARFALRLEQVSDDRDLAQESESRRRRPARCCRAVRRSRTTGRRAARRRFRRAASSAPGMRKPPSVTPFAKSSVLTSGRTLQADHVAGDRRREVQPDAELLELRSSPAPVLPWTTGTGNSPPARKLASWPL